MAEKRNNPNSGNSGSRPVSRPSQPTIKKGGQGGKTSHGALRDSRPDTFVSGRPPKKPTGNNSK